MGSARKQNGGLLLWQQPKLDPKSRNEFAAARHPLCYKITGADGKEYGPATIEQMRRWISEGRVNPQTRVFSPETGDWRLASECAELQGILEERSAAIAAAGQDPGVFSMGVPPQDAPSAPPKNSLAIASMVLGILGLICFGLITGLPAIICGHIAHNRSRRDPVRYGGGGFAIAGFVLGYCSIFMTIIIAAMLLPALAKAKSRAHTINCVNNLKMVGLAFKLFQVDHEDLFPGGVSTTNGGTMELSGPADNPVPTFQVLSNELVSTKILVCPSDTSRKPAATFQQLSPLNISYMLSYHPGIETNLDAELLVCPNDGNRLLVDGSVHQQPRQNRR